MKIWSIYIWKNHITSFFVFTCIFIFFISFFDIVQNLCVSTDVKSLRSSLPTFNYFILFSSNSYIKNLQIFLTAQVKYSTHCSHFFSIIFMIFKEESNRNFPVAYVDKTCEWVMINFSSEMPPFRWHSQFLTHSWQLSRLWVSTGLCPN